MAVSAGLVLVRKISNRWHILIGHPGGPFYRRRNEHVWSIPKGLVEPDEDYIHVARRETFEETGLEICGPFIPLPEVKYKSGKRVVVWATLGPPPDRIINPPPSSTFVIEYPPHSGKMQEFPEIDYIKYADFSSAKKLLVKGQVAIVEFLESSDGENILDIIALWQNIEEADKCF